MRRSPLGAACVLAALAGCSTDDLVFTTYSKIGVDVSSISGTPAQMVLGYKRFEGAILPVDPTDPDAEAPAIWALLDFENPWLHGLEIRQGFATGAAAVQQSRLGDRGLLGAPAAAEAGR